MRKLASILILSLTFTACTNSERANRDVVAEDTTLQMLDTTNKAQVYTADVNLNGDEKIFLLNTSLTLQRSNEFAHLASQKAQNSALKDQAQKLQDDYSKMLTDLKSIAKGKGVILSSNESSADLEGLKTLDSDRFDAAYAKLILLAHNNLIQQLTNGEKLSNADIKNFSTNGLAIANQNNINIAKKLK